MRSLVHIVSFVFVSGLVHAQDSRLAIADEFLASNFATFHSVDREIGYCMAPILEERIVFELKDSMSLSYPFDSLSHYVRIKTSIDSCLRTYSWDRLSGGSWHDMASYVQYKTASGSVLYQRLDTGDEGGTGEPTDVIIYDVHTLKINGVPHYLLLGWGTHGGGMHHTLARVFRIEQDILVQSNSIFQGEKYLSVHTSRSNPIEMVYDANDEEISFLHYDYDDELDHYKSLGVRQKWKLNNGLFVKQ